MSQLVTRSFRVRWYDSAVLRSAALVTLIMIAAYAASIMITAQGFDTIASIVHRENVEKSFSEHLDRIREVHNLKQDAFITKLKTVIPPTLRVSPSATTTESELRKWFELAKLDDVFDTQNVTISKSFKDSSEGQKDSKNIYWIGMQKLRVFDQLITFPRGDTYAEFSRTEEMQKRYKFVGNKLQSEIKPALIKANSFVLLATFLLLIIAFLVLARRFNQKVEKLINGISYWSEVDQGFRFGKEFDGELLMICNQFNRMADEVEENRQKRLYLEKVASWQTIARKLAHEIKNPLTPIQMMISQLTKGYNGEDEKYGKLLENSQAIINEEVDSLRRMVDHFSKFARLPDPKIQEYDIVDLVNKVVDLQKAAFTEHALAVECDGDTAIGYLDPDLIKQVLINLIKNAAEASAPERPSKIAVRIEATETNWLIKVIDDGPGVPEDLQSKIFEAYFTTKHTGPTPGMGLGLAVCQKILLDHFGELKLRSQPGHTEFILVIPKERRK